MVKASHPPGENGAAPGLDGWKDEDGCPDPDNDGDGINDDIDRCPMEAEDLDQFEDEDGCPDLDNDGDGIADAVDGCPLAPETINGYQDDDGCPDDPPKVDATSQPGDLDEKIYFDLNRSRIKRRSHPLLGAVVRALESSPALRIRVEGHTDETGSEAWNQELSQDRAAAVRDYLIDKGIAADRLEAVGYANTRPMVEGTTDAARRKNRRVEFVIID
jgi:outer membrane protein OmpA-like peptidoglycan-associated protein